MKEVFYFRYLDDDSIERIRIRFKTDKGKFIFVVIQYESYIKNKWTEIVRYDCAHGYFHRDILYPNGEKEKEVISIDNLKDAYNYAEQDIKDHWQFYRERYLKKMKS